MSLPAAANVLWGCANVPRWLAYRRALHDPRRVQAAILKRYLAGNADTQFGRAHRFAGIRSVEEYQARVPVMRYDDYAPWIDRIMEGQHHVLTRQPVIALVPSSGSSGAAKLIPYTRTLQQEFNAAIGPWIVDLYRRQRALAGGPAYWSISPVAPPPMNRRSAVPIGFDEDSAYLGGLGKRLVDATLAVPAPVRLISHVESFRYVTLLFLLRCGALRLISVWHPSFLALLMDALPRHWNALLQDIAEGLIRPPDPLPPGLADCLRIRPDPIRVAALESLGEPRPADLWPRLRLISCWADAHARTCVDPLRRAFPQAYVQPKGLIATEAFVSLPFGEQHPLAIASHFFEFLDHHGQPRLVHELEPDQEYSVIITTGGGLHRYHLGDRIRVTGWIDSTPSVEFLGKEDSVSDLCGEKLSEAFVAQALEKVFARFGLAPAFAMLAPDPNNGLPGYTLFFEATVLPPVELAATVDAELRANPHYDYCIRLGQLSPIRLFHVQHRGYEHYARRCIELGQRLGNIKATSLTGIAGWSGVFDGAYLHRRIA